jgi:hypothetical protein
MTIDPSGPCPIDRLIRAAAIIKTLNPEISIARCEYAVWIVGELVDVCVTRRPVVTLELWDVFFKVREKKAAKK